MFISLQVRKAINKKRIENPISGSYLGPPFLWNKFLTQSGISVSPSALFEWKLGKMHFDFFFQIWRVVVSIEYRIP